MESAKEVKRRKGREYYQNNRQKCLRQKLNYRLTNPRNYLLKNAKDRAKRRKIDFNLDLEDIIIPEFCPVLGIRLEYATKSRKDNSLSLDRIDSSKGYIKGNVRVISWRANDLKKNATLQELEQLVLYLKGDLT